MVISEQLHRRHATQLLRDVVHRGETPEIEAQRELEKPREGTRDATNRQQAPRAEAAVPAVNPPAEQSVPVVVPAEPVAIPAVAPAPDAPAQQKKPAFAEPVRRLQREHRAPLKIEDEYSGKGSTKRKYQL